MAGRVRVREISDDEGVVTGIVQEFQFGMNWSNYSVFVAFRVYPRRAILGATLMVTQSFLYNAIFFTYALVLTRFYHVSNNNVLLYGLTFAVGNLAGPLLLGHLFDTIGRKKMISGTYLISGLARLLVRGCSRRGALSAAGQAFIWIVVFLFASAGSSAGYLTQRDLPVEIRAEVLAVFFVEETWRIVQPLLDHPPDVRPYPRGVLGPEEAEALPRGHPRWQQPWLPAKG